MFETAKVVIFVGICKDTPDKTAYAVTEATRSLSIAERQMRLTCWVVIW